MAEMAVATIQPTGQASQMPVLVAIRSLKTFASTTRSTRSVKVEIMK